MNSKKFVNISITDKSLFIFILLLFFQHVYTLFFITPVSNIDNSLDVVFRTSLASIFGYILSSRFAKTNQIKTDNLSSTPPNNTIGFTTVDPSNNITNKYTPMLSADTKLKDQITVSTPTPMDDYKKDTSYTNNNEASYCQVVITASIGLLALVTLMFYRNFVASNDAPIAALSQLRDILSGSIGFLIGATSNK